MTFLKRLNKATKMITSSLFALGFLWTILLPPAVLASAYGSGGYSDCTYSTGCSAATGSGGSSSGGGTSTPTKPDKDADGSGLILNDFDSFFTGDGKALNLKKNQIVYFDVTQNGQTVRYTVTITNVGKNYIDFAITPGTITDRMFIGDVKAYDVNGDGQNDIEMTLNSISASGLANITFKALSPVVAPTPTPSTPVTTTKSSSWLLISSIAAIALGLVIFIIYFIRRRKRNNQQF